MMDVWQETFPVRFGFVDRSDRLTPSQVFSWFEAAAIAHAEILGCGREAMKQTGQGWVLSRIGVFMARRPRFGEEVVVRTWPRGAEKLFAVRDYSVSGLNEEPFVLSRSGWLVLDLEKRRPLRAQTIMENLPHNEGRDAMKEFALSLKSRETYEKAGERKACYSDVDYNGHVNNVRYIQWIQDITDMAFFEEAAQIRIDINYLSEVKPGETVELFKTALSPADAASPPGQEAEYPAKPAAAFAYEGLKESDGQCAFRAEIRTGA